MELSLLLEVLRHRFEEMGLPIEQLLPDEVVKGARLASFAS